MYISHQPPWTQSAKLTAYSIRHGEIAGVSPLSVVSWQNSGLGSPVQVLRKKNVQRPEFQKITALRTSPEVLFIDHIVQILNSVA